MAGAKGPLAEIGRISLIGAGSAGSALARALDARGARIVALASRHAERAESLAASLASRPPVVSPAEAQATADLVFLAVPDDAIAPLAASLAWRPKQAAIHLSGSRGVDALASVLERGAQAAALHPLMTFPRGAVPLDATEQVARMAGCVWALEASTPELGETLEMVVAALGGTVVRLRVEDRVPYHIAAVLASNYVTTLLAAATTLWEPFATDDNAALRALLPLLRASVESLERVGLPDALTGPIARGDTGTIASHLAWLDAHAADDPALADLRAAYLALARLAVPIAKAKGALTPEAVEALRRMLS